ncbi:MAG: winged helix-turn-helix domain-containing protein [Anaerolineae bacterium]|nr:winged helix-turn-helix domain-containing protein [Anaerolineae bacterium]
MNNDQSHSASSLRLIERDLYLPGRERAIRLRPTEASLLATLLRYSNQIVSRATLMREVWQTDFLDDTRTLDVHIHWLRRKIEDNPNRPRRLVTVKGVGYCLMVESKRQKGPQ